MQILHRAPLLALLVLVTSVPGADELLLRVERVVEGAHDLYVSVRRGDDGTLAGFATTPTWNKATHAIQLDNLVWTDAAITGNVVCEMRADAWVPAQGTRPPVGILSLDLKEAGKELLGEVRWAPFAADGTVAQGQVKLCTAQRRAAAPPAEVQTLAILLPEGIALPGVKSHRAEVILRACLVGGKATAASVRANRISSWGSFNCWTEQASLEVRDGRFTGQVVLAFEDGAPTHTWILDGVVVGEELRGTNRRKVGDGEPTIHTFAGSLIDLPEQAVDPGNADYELMIRRGEGRGSADIVWLAARDGVFIDGFAISPTVTRSNHRVDVSRLKLHEGSIQGQLTVLRTVNGWSAPTDDRTYDLLTTVAGGSVTGAVWRWPEPPPGRTTDGMPGEQIGVVRGLCRPIAAPAKRLYYLQLEDSLSAESYWQSRCFLGFTIAPDAEPTPAFMRSDHPEQSKWSGILDKVLAVNDPNLTPDEMAAHLRTTVTSSGSNRSGTYTFDIAGRRIGDCYGGSMVSSIGTEELKRGRVWGIVLKPGWDNGVIPPPFVEPNQPKP